ncbi:MAG: hypothetical protein OXE94_09850 [Aestuariivita sp.]|nr:hypothetical protein [Aestuariivita sp.]MCY4203920.1 hypothetical protein [Aestuariivita sp.]
MRLATIPIQFVRSMVLTSQTAKARWTLPEQKTEVSIKDREKAKKGTELDPTDRVLIIGCSVFIGNGLVPIKVCPWKAFSFINKDSRVTNTPKTLLSRPV